MNRVALLLFAGLLASPAFADPGQIPVRLKDHKFTPSEIHVKANQPTIIALTNDDDSAEEFDSPALKVEKVVAGHSEGAVRLRPLEPGKYPYTGEFHAETARGVVIAE